MPINIIPASKPIPVSTLVTLILGQPGVGKTTLSNTCDKPLLLDFDQGSYRSVNRPDVVYIKQWKEIGDLQYEDLKPYKTVVLDTVGRCLDLLAEDIIANDSKMGTAGGDQLSISGFGRLKGRFRSWLNKIRGWGINVVLIAHATEERQGDSVRLRVDGQGSSKEEVYKTADLLGRLTIKGKRRWLDYDPAEDGFGKNPAGIKAGSVPDIRTAPHLLQEHIRTTLDHIGRKQAETMAEEQRLNDLQKSFERITDPEEFSEIARNMRKIDAPRADRAILVSIAMERGWKFDKESATFTDPNAKPKQDEAQPQDGEQGEGEKEQLAF